MCLFSFRKFSVQETVSYDCTNHQPAITPHRMIGKRCILHRLDKRAQTCTFPFEEFYFDLLFGSETIISVQVQFKFSKFISFLF